MLFLLIAFPAPQVAPIGQAPELPSVQIEVHCETVSTRKAARPHIDLALGVCSGDWDAVAGLQAPVFARGRTDEKGLASFTLRVPSELAKDPSARVWIRAESPGYWRTNKTARFAKVADVQRLVVGRGGTLFGRVHTSRGNPAAGVRVWVTRDGDGDDGEKLYSRRANERGHFYLHFGRSARYSFHARSCIGEWSLLHVEERLDRDVLMPVLDLTLEPVPPILGRVLDPAGVPVAGAGVLVVPAGAGGLPSARECSARERDAHLIDGRARADASGHFEIGRLVPGEYDFYAELSPGGGWQSRPDPSYDRERRSHVPIEVGSELTHLARRIVGESTEGLSLVYPVHRVVARVRRPDGSAVPFEETFEPGEEIGVHMEVSLPEHALTIVARGGESRTWWSDELYWPRVVGDTFVYALEPGRDYFAIWLGGRDVVERPWSTGPADPWQVTFDFELVPPDSHAKLVVQVEDPAGHPRPPIVSICTEQAGYELPMDWGREGDRWSCTVPAGSFTLEAKDYAPRILDCTTVSPEPREKYRRVTQAVELVPGQTREVLFRLGAAGYLDFEASGPQGVGREDERFPRHAPHSVYGESPIYRDAGARRAFGGGVASLVPFDSPGFASPGVESQRDPIHGLEFLLPGFLFTDFDWILPGWEARCMTPLPPGSWIFRVAGDDGVLFERRVVIEAGETTVVRW